MSRQKRYTAKFEIQAEIISERRRMKEMNIQCDLIEQDMNKHRKAMREGREHEQQWHLDQISGLGQKLDKLHRAMVSIEESRIPRLVRTLAAFDTETFAFVTDRSINRQPQ